MAEATVNQQVLPAPDGQGMVAVAPRQINPIDAVAQSRAVRHISKLAGLAAAVAVGMVVVLWTAEPNYAPLYSKVSSKNASQIADALMSKDIDFKLDAASGTLLVDQTKLSEARLLLASQGIADGSDNGMDKIFEEQDLGVDDFTKKKRYLHALETELARSVESIRAVESARVHLAIPRDTIFIRNRKRPSASVMVTLYPGRTLSDGNVEAIVQTIASAVPDMAGSDVKVVDQFGRLLTSDQDHGMSQTTRQFEYTRKLEDSYVDNIIELLQPIVGEGKVNAQVSAQLDFSQVESTRQAYDPERSVILSQQTNEQISRNLSQALGIPGALSNQPPAAGAIEQEAGLEGEAVEADAANEVPTNQTRSDVTNYQNDVTYSHTSNPAGEIQRLSVAVLIDDKQQVADDGSISKIAYSDEEIAIFTNLVKDTIGFDANRGDTVTIVSKPFIEIEQPELEPIPAWQSLLNEAWIVNLIKQVLGALGLLIVYFIFIRPILRSLKHNDEPEATAAAITADGAAVQTLGAPVPMQQQGMMMGAQAPGGGDLGIPNLAEDPNNPAAMVRRKDATYEQKVDMARSLVMDDPARVANVMKHWVGDE